MEVPDYLKNQINEGNAILFLGSGASLGALNAAGASPPTAKKLSQLLADKFLGGKYRDGSLSQVAEFAITESDLVTVQEFVRSLLLDFEPTEAHRLVTTFRWRALATTNYDRIVERAYETTKGSVQIVAPFIENGDRVDDALRNQSAIAYLKLHGCITKVNNPKCPLILAPDQYADYRSGRDRLFRHLEELGCERPILFIGHSLDDPDLRHVLLEIPRLVPSRPRYYVVAPDVDDFKTRLWEKHHITALKGTFDEFFADLNKALPSAFRGVAAAPTTGTTHPIGTRFTVPGSKLSPACGQFLMMDVDYVSGVKPETVVDPKDFYRGMSGDWSPIEQNLDVRRGLTDEILAEYFLDPESGHLDRMELVAVKAEAGAGKSVLLRRIAWDAAQDYKCLCLFLKPHGLINSAAIQELVTLCNQRIYLFVDRLGERVREITALAQSLGKDGARVTVVGSERVNEWHVSCIALDPLVSDTYTLRYLTEAEVDSLLAKLEQHRALFTLERATTEDRRKAFVQHAGRQLLVALHEATLGEPFADIIENEYRTVVPLEAQKMYLTVSTLNRLGVPVRAGLISRIHGISFEQFREKFFGPLAHIVSNRIDPVSRDHVYTARHPHIADIVFERALTTQEERFNEYVSILNHINIDYAPDRRAFRGLMRGKTIIDLFPNHDFARNLFDLAAKAATSDSHLCQQEAIYEMNRSNGNLKNAHQLLILARELTPYDKSIQHSLAEYYVRAAENARSDLEKEHLRDEALKICGELRRRGADNSYPFHTLVKLEIGRLQDMLAKPVETVPDAEVEQVWKDAETYLRDGLQRFPGDSHLLSAESELATLLVDSERALKAMEKALSGNRRNAYIALRLARIYEKRDRRGDALKVLRQSLEANASDKQLHFSYAACLMNEPGLATAGEIKYHLQRSFGPGDQNFEARLLYGRELYLSGAIAESKALFNELRNARIAPQFKDKIQHPLPETLEGSITRKDASYCFIARDGSGDWIFAHASKIHDDVWRGLLFGDRVTFRMGFSCRGPGAFDVTPIHKADSQ